MDEINALMHGFGVALSWQNAGLMLVGILLGIVVGCCPAWAARTGWRSCCR